MCKICCGKEMSTSEHECSDEVVCEDCYCCECNICGNSCDDCL